MAKKKSKSRSGSSAKTNPASRRRGPHAGQSGKPRRPSAAQVSASASARPRRSKSRSKTNSDPNVQRLQRVMASAGIGSRRECEVIILEGRVEVDGETVVELGTKVDITKQSVSVDAVELKTQKLQYFMLNKPPGIVSTSSDPSGRMRVIDLINTRNRVYNVGRLDKSSEGLILVTNDGDLANHLTHPRFGVEKKYHVQVVGHPNQESMQALTDGVYLAEGRAKATGAKYLKRVKDTSWIELVLQEGRNREIRRLLAKIGHKVLTLRRVSIGTLRLGELPVGAHRELTAIELRALKKTSSTSKTKGRSAAKKSIATRKKPRDLAEVKEAAKKPTRSTKSAAKTASKSAKKKKASSRSAAKGGKAAKPVRKESGGRGRSVAAPKLRKQNKKKRRR